MQMILQKLKTLNYYKNNLYILCFSKKMAFANKKQPENL